MLNYLTEAWYLILPYFKFGWVIVLTVWWVILPFYAFKLLHWSYFLWKNTEWFLENGKSILLEFKFPREITKPLKVMEDVFSVIWGAMFDPPNFKERYFEGKFNLNFSLEIVSLEGIPHFYIRIPEGAKKMIEAAVHSQYPSVEISEAEDYTKKIPLDVPNKEWDLWGCNYMPPGGKEDVYPIKTYKKFFEQNVEAQYEEKRTDPISNLVEGFSKLGKGEQLWFQIVASSASDDENDYVKRGKATINELAKRPGPKKEKSLFEEIFNILFKSQDVEEKKDDKLLPPEMFLTPGERDIISAIEEKISKLGFNASVRALYLAKRENYFSPNKIIPIAYMNQFQDKSLNALIPWKPTLTKVQAPDIFQERRTFLKKRDLYLRYINRVSPFTPYRGGTCLLNVEEMATLFHFPGFEVAPTPQLERLEIKKAPPPPTLPVE